MNKKKNTNFTFMTLKYFQELRTKKPNIMTKDVPIAHIAQKIPRVWGAMSQELCRKANYI